MKHNHKLIRLFTCVVASVALFASCQDDENPIIPLPPLTPPESTGEKVIAVVDQSLHQVLLVDATSNATLWSWRASESGLNATQQSWFELPDEVKPIYNCKYLLIVGTRGGVGIVRISDKKMMFFAQPKGQPHSAEILPDGNLVVVSSTDGTSEGDKMRLYKVDTTARFGASPIGTYELKFGHNAVWDRTNSLLWATADDVLRSYRYTTDANQQPTLVLQDSYQLPDGAKSAHELFPVHGLNQLWLTTGNSIYKFNVSTKQFAKFSANTVANIKSISSGPAGYPTILLFPTTSYWSDKLIDTGGRIVYQKVGAMIYKGRWLLDNTFSYPAQHNFVQPQ